MRLVLDAEAVNALLDPRHPVGLEYTITAVACGFTLHRGLSRGDVVFARESAEDLFSADLVLGEVDLRRVAACLSRCELVEGAVRPGGVAVAHVLGQYLAQVVLACDEQPVEDLAAQGADHLLADGVCPGRLRPA